MDPEKANKASSDNMAQLTSGTVGVEQVTAGGLADGLDFAAPAKKGTYMSFLIMIIGIVLSIITYRYSDNFHSSAFTDYCNNSDYESSCKANSAVLRVSLALTLIYAIQIIGTFVYTPFYDFLWVIKMCAFLAVVIGLFFVDGKSFGTEGYAWFARITGFFYLILQQVILIDMAYSWNESWLNRATSSDGERGCYWLSGLIIISGAFFALSLTVIGLLYWQFDQCDENTVIISVTLGLCIFSTAVQMFFTEEGNLMTSAIVMLYSTYICYCAVTLNPSSNCNPTLDSGYQTISAVIGIILTVISLIWTTYNTVHSIPQVVDGSTGTAVNLSAVSRGNPGDPPPPSTYTEVPKLNSLLVQVSIVFMCASGYYAMVLTNWATEQTTSSINQARVGSSAMWIQASGSWVAVAIYLWTLIAPKLFPDREF